MTLDYTTPPPRSLTAPFPPPADRRIARLVTAVILVGATLLLFVRLGHYALWDDEAITALTARAVWHTGDTSAHVDDHNWLLYRDGLLTRNLKDRYTPPLQFYVFAPVAGWFYDSNFALRTPSALFGLLTVGLILRWLWRTNPPPAVWWAAAVVLLTNASFFLFFRQCRYYGLSMMLTTWVGYLYFFHDGTKKATAWMAVALCLLLACQYLNYAAAVACLMFDYAIWGRKDRRLGLADWAILLLPQLIVGGVVCSIWNPVARQGGAEVYNTSTYFADRLRLFWWNWRDTFASDFIVMPLLLVCPVMYAAVRNNWLLRGPAALVVYMTALTLCVTTVVTKAGVAEIRYMAPILPMCVGLGVLGVWALMGLRPNLSPWFLAFAAITIVAMPPPQTFRNARYAYGPSFLQYWIELIRPASEPYTPTIQWVRDHVRPGQSIYVMPPHMAYPLMARTDGPTYAWQLIDPPARPEFQQLPDTMFKNRTPPDYLISFGSEQTADIRNTIAAYDEQGIRYEQVDTIPVFWKDMYRPEIVWRTFKTVRMQDADGVYIYRRVP